MLIFAWDGFTGLFLTVKTIIITVSFNCGRGFMISINIIYVLESLHEYESKNMVHVLHDPHSGVQRDRCI